MFLLLVLPSYFMAGLRSGPEYFFYFLMCGYGASVLAFCLVNLIAIAAFNAPVATIVASSFFIFVFCFVRFLIHINPFTRCGNFHCRNARRILYS